MSKETAHQLGTPISSLVAWLEILQEEEEKEIYREMKKDVDRLSLIANRFSKIGSSPTLEEIEIVPVLQGAIEYMRQRAPKKVDIVLQSDLRFFDKAIFNPSLFEWVLENLIRNSLDAMSGKGFIHIHAFRVAQTIVIDLTDNGKGIPKKYWQKIFNPGYSTKKRGWGLGLSLAHRIIKDYHKGDIFVTQSEQNKGTTFRIILNTW